MKPVFILVPSFDPTGPIKGAFALASVLVRHYSVTLVALKAHPVHALPVLDANVSLYSLAASGGWISKLSAYRRLLREARVQSGSQPVSISLCFSADLVNAACSGEARIISSVRSNLLKDYRYGYGFPGVPLALIHYVILNRFDHVIAMTHSMASEINRFATREPVVIGNFVDENFLEPYRRQSSTGEYRFIFLGSLTARKQPLLLVQAMARLLETGVEARLDVVGGGPLEEEVQRIVAQLGLEGRVVLHGHLSDPYPLLAAADVMVLPSLSEGLSRASLEALYLGVPCVLRDVDGNGELISEGLNGSLFVDEDALAESMLVAAKLRKTEAPRGSLLPEVFQQAYVENCYLKLIDKIG